jgi:hypothetical protein
VLLAPPQLMKDFGEDIMMLLTTCSISLLCFGACIPIYHVAHYIKLEENRRDKEIHIKTELFIRGGSFFIFGTAFFLLTFFYSFIIMLHILLPSTSFLWIVILLATLVIVILITLTIDAIMNVISDLFTLRKTIN